MKHKINIMYIMDYFHEGGTETHITALVSLLDKKIFNTCIVIFDLKENTLIKKIIECGVPVIHIPVGRYYNFNAVRRAFQLSKLIKKNNIDIVQTFFFKSDVYGALLAQLSGVKKIISSKRDIGDLDNTWHFFLKRRINRFVDGFIAVCDKVGKVVAQKENLPLNNIKTIYNGVDIKRFYPPDAKDINKARKELGLKLEDFVIGIVAGFRPEKNYEIFFEAVENVQHKIKNLKVVAVGNGPLLGYFKEYCQKKELSDKTIFTGFIEDIRQYLTVLDVGCLVPNINEGFSNAILEKMAMGLPLIVTDVGGNAEAVLDGYNGILIPPCNATALADALFDLYQNPNKRNEMGQRSRQRVEEHFTLEKMIKAHEDYYISIINS